MGVTTMTGNRADALARLDVFVGEWVIEARFPGDQPTMEEGPRGRSRFEWDLGRQVLLQRTEVPVPEAPDSLTIVSADLGTGAYTQHYYDSRVSVHTRSSSVIAYRRVTPRESPDFSPLDFAQRFTGTFSADGTAISGAWEKRLDRDWHWQHDFALTYRRTG